MDFEKFQTECKRTCPDLGGDRINLPHMVLGMGSEMVELYTAISKDDKVNISEEIADIFWYLGNYCTFRNYRLPYFYFSMDYVVESMSIYDVFNDLFLQISELQDIVKKNMAYGKEINTDIEEIILKHIVEILCLMASNLEIDVVKSLENNINKLKIRYPVAVSE
jgi:hypothetical protein